MRPYDLAAEDRGARAWAIRQAHDALTVKAGKYATRPIDAHDLIVVATWLLTGRCIDSPSVLPSRAD